MEAASKKLKNKERFETFTETLKVVVNRKLCTYRFLALATWLVERDMKRKKMKLPVHPNLRLSPVRPQILIWSLICETKANVICALHYPILTVMETTFMLLCCNLDALEFFSWRPLLFFKPPHLGPYTTQTTPPHVVYKLSPSHRHCLIS